MHFLSRLILGGLFVYASIGKILNPSSFAIAISNYKVLPEFMVMPLAFILPNIEFVFGVILIFGLWEKISASILSLLLVVFIIAISSTIMRGIDISCGCFTKFLQEPGTNNHSPWFLIARDLLLLIPGIIIIFASDEKQRLANKKKGKN